MTLSEIESRIQEINNELTELQQKVDQYFNLYEHLKWKYHSCFSSCPGPDFWKPQSQEEAELQNFQSKIYKLEAELEELDNKKFQIKVDEIKDRNRFIDEEYLKSFPTHLGVQYVSITYVTDKSVGIMCSNSYFIALTSEKEVSSDLHVGQTIYS